jgi:hypothetical protein
MLNVDKEGIVSLPDGRVVNTVAAAQFRLVPQEVEHSVRVMRDDTPYSTPDEARPRDMVYGASSSLGLEAAVEEHLACGMTVAMYGVAEGRRLDGSVQTATTWWKVCAL